MGRARISMELIQKEKARKTTYQKRKNSLVKKVCEFSILCGVDVCIIIYAPKFDSQGLDEPEIWPKDREEVHRIIQKYLDTTRDRRPKIYDMHEYYDDRMRKVEAEISKRHKDKLKKIYPTWRDSFNALRKQEMRIFDTIVDAKLVACGQRKDKLKGNHKGKEGAELDKVKTLNPCLASNPSCYLNLMQNISQAQLGNVVCDPKTGVLKEDGAENNQNLSSCNYNGYLQIVQPHTIPLQTLPSQNSRYESTCPIPLASPNGFQHNGLYDPNMLQAQMFNYMHEKRGA